MYLLICNSIYTSFVRHPVQCEWGKTAEGKVLGKILKPTKHQFFCLEYINNIIILLFYLFPTQNNHQLKFLVHQNRENAK